MRPKCLDETAAAATADVPHFAAGRLRPSSARIGVARRFVRERAFRAARRFGSYLFRAAPAARTARDSPAAGADVGVEASSFCELLLLLLLLLCEEMGSPTGE